VRSEIRGSLERHLPRAAPSDEELFAMRKMAWQAQELIIIRLTDVRDDWIRQALINLANRLYGPRDTA
jgi:hypothetical protein